MEPSLRWEQLSTGAGTRLAALVGRRCSANQQSRRNSASPHIFPQGRDTIGAKRATVRGRSIWCHGPLNLTLQPSALMKPARQIHRSDSVASWLDDVDACDPYIRSRVEYAVDAIQDDRITVGLCQSLLVGGAVGATTIGSDEFSPTPQQAYTQLRDWVCKPCPELEKWLASEIVPLFPTLSNALDHISLPDTILDDETVKVWLVKANIVDPALHRDLTVLIRTRSLKYGRHLPVPDKTRVRSSPTPTLLWLIPSR